MRNSYRDAGDVTVCRLQCIITPCVQRKQICLGKADVIYNTLHHSPLEFIRRSTNISDFHFFGNISTKKTKYVNKKFLDDKIRGNSRWLRPTSNRSIFQALWTDKSMNRETQEKTIFLESETLKAPHMQTFRSLRSVSSGVFYMQAACGRVSILLSEGL